MKLVKPGNLQNILRVVTANIGERKFNISEIESPIINGFRFCKWCAKHPVYGQKQYCSEDCKFSMACFCYPQTFPATRVMLERQDFKCAVCDYSYIEAIEKAIEKCRSIDPTLDWEINAEWIMGTAKDYMPKERYPEADHKIAISNGGESFGLANMHLICYSCHKSKTSAEARKRNKEQNTYSGSRSTFKKVRDSH